MFSTFSSWWRMSKFFWYILMEAFLARASHNWFVKNAFARKTTYIWYDYQTKSVKSLKFSPVTTVTEFSDNEKSGKRIFYLKSDFSMERIKVRSLKSCFDWVLFLLTWTTTSLATISINFRLFWNENSTKQHAYVCSCNCN